MELLTGVEDKLPYGYTGPTMVSNGQSPSPQFGFRTFLILSLSNFHPQIITGEWDYDFCTSDCNGGALEEPARQIFSKAKAFKTVSYPDTGHGINLHLTAVGAFKEITDFLSASGF